MSMPVFTSPGRSGFGPQLGLTYDSGAGNGPFGFGWSLSLPSITRKTDKGLPRYEDATESDIFLLSHAEDLVPVLLPDGNRFADTASAPGFTIHHYRPRVESAFARIERWTNNNDPADVHWRSISPNNVLSLYGKDRHSRIADPLYPERIFQWLICETRDDRGNAIIYQYKAEDGSGVNLAQLHQRNRGDVDDPRRRANRYLKRIHYGNRVSLLDEDGKRHRFLTDEQIQNAGWMFEVVFDYGEHNLDVPEPQGTALWSHRQDTFSTYRPGFEVRTSRQCQRVLMFHHFPDEAEVGDNCLVRSTDFTYSHEVDPASTTNPVYTFLVEVAQRGYRREGAGYAQASMPPVNFMYSQPVVQGIVEDVPPDSLENLPTGVDGAGYQWTDLHGEGIPGILTEQGGTWFYKRNLSPLGSGMVALGPLERISDQPNAALAQGALFMDLAGDGQPDLVLLGGPTPGLYEHDSAENWQPFRAFSAQINLDPRDPHLRFTDLDGDGRADILLTEEEAFIWHASLGEAGFGPAQFVAQMDDEELGPRLIFAGDAQSIYLADMSGDGLNDLVRVRDGEVCYWPNLGYGRFGAKVSMDNAPHFDAQDQFDPQRIRLADIDGTGTTDIIYLHREGVRLYFNQSGNGWSQTQAVPVFPNLDNLASIMTADLFGTGTTCLVWSSTLPGDSARPMRYINLMGAGDQPKPHLLTAIINNLGAETRLQYAPSTRFYLQDRRAGQPWITRLPFPVQVVERIETVDRVSRNRFATRFAYHHGYFDGEEREFRGFGMVEQWDTEELAVLTSEDQLPAANMDPVSHVPPLHTKTWFHTGAYIDRDHISHQYADEYFEDASLTGGLLPDTILPDGLTTAEEREACRALKGKMLRQEVYADDAPPGSSAAERARAALPFTVLEQNFTVRVMQRRLDQRSAVFYTHPREKITYQYERSLTEPRIQHSLTLEVNDFGSVLKEAAVAYGRRTPDLSLPLQEDRDAQARLWVTYSEHSFTNTINDPAAHPHDFRAPLPCETITYEITGIEPGGDTDRFRFSEWTAGDFALPLSAETIPYEQAANGGPQKRPLKHSRTLYRADDFTALLPFGEAQPLALPGERYQMAFSPGLLAQIYQRSGESLLPDPAEVLAGRGPDRGGYIASQTLKAAGMFPGSDPDDHWWLPAGQVFYSPDGANSPVQEMTFARDHFFLPHRYQDPFGQSTSVSYEYDLLLLEVRDPLGSRVTVGERSPAGEIDPNIRGNDFRILQPRCLMDPNRNRSQVTFDLLGLVVGTAEMGKPEESLGASLESFQPDLSEADRLAHLASPLNDPHAILGGAAKRMIYDLFAYQRTQNQLIPQPAVVYIMARETYASDLVPGEQTRIQHSFVYSDGFGREIQKKIQAEAGPVPQRDDAGSILLDELGQPQMTAEDASPRWVGSGWTVYNNKGKPVRQFEPFFTDTHRFEFDSRIGVSPIIFYDPLDRVVTSLLPNHTFEKVIFDPWQQTSFDVNDTSAPSGAQTGDPRSDPDIAGYVQAYFQSQPAGWETWHALRQGGGMGAREQDAANKAAAHAATPITAYLNALGRPFLTLSHNRVVCAGHDLDGTEEITASRVELDIEGHQRAVRDAVIQDGDALGRVVMRYDYDMLGNRIHQASMESGERWILADAAGKPIRAWDSRGHITRSVYDVLRRPLRTFVQGAGPANPDEELLTERLVYGEQHPQAEQRNLRRRVFLHMDQAGVITNEAYTFQGNLFGSSRRMTGGTQYRQVVDWRAVDSDTAVLPADPAVPIDLAALDAAIAPRLEAETFNARTRYDALNRPIQLIAPHSDQAAAAVNVIQPRYNEANLLEQVHAWLGLANEPSSPLDPDDGALPLMTDIDYDAKGQRQRVDYGNGTISFFDYDPLTFRLIRLRTERRAADFPDDCPQPPPLDWPGCLLQDLRYTYDPVGNVTHWQDEAQQAIFFHNTRVDPAAEYTYDALYRLIQASGREHLGQVGGQPLAHSHNDAQRTGLESGDGLGRFSAADGQAMGRYIERYVYDAVGNFLSMRHAGSNPVHPGWTRSYAYDEVSQTEPAKRSNRLSSTTIGGSPPETYQYDAHGNITRMAHLAGHPDPGAPNLHWDYRDRFYRADLLNGGAAYYIYDSAGQRMRKVIERQNGTRQSERLYLGGFEIYREYNGASGDVDLERESLHIMHDRERVALVETRTRGSDDAPPQIVRFQLGDHLGSAALELDSNAQIISYEEYSPFGSTTYQAVRSDTETPKRYRFTGKERDEESGLYYHGARFYAPWLGRWISTDPSGLVDGTNLYRYTHNNPIRFTDSTGKNCDPTNATCPELMGNWSYAEPVPDRSSVGHNVQRDHPIQVSLRAEQRGRTNRQQRSVSASRGETTVLVETGRGYFHTEVGELQKEINARVRAGLITSESELIEATRHAYRLAGERAGVTVNAEALDRAIVSNLATLSETAEQTASELRALGATGEDYDRMMTSIDDWDPDAAEELVSRPPDVSEAPADPSARASAASTETPEVSRSTPAPEVPVDARDVSSAADATESVARRAGRRILMAIPVVDVVYQQIDYENTAYTGYRTDDMVINLTVAELWEIPMAVFSVGEILWEGAKIQGRQQAEAEDINDMIGSAAWGGS